jgi:hypothetical protein
MAPVILEPQRRPGSLRHHVRHGTASRDARSGPGHLEYSDRHYLNIMGQNQTPTQVMARVLTRLASIDGQPPD